MLDAGIGTIRLLSGKSSYDTAQFAKPVLDTRYIRASFTSNTHDAPNVGGHLIIPILEWRLTAFKVRRRS